MTLEEFNTADTNVARIALLQCCGSKHWAEAVLKRRPFPDRDTLLSAADSVWWTLKREDWLEAFSAHPKIGQKKLSGWSSEEQRGIDSAGANILERLAQRNEQYEQRFGWIFLVHATGKNAHELLALLEARLKNEAEEEFRIAAGEQAKIMKLRLSKLLTL